MASFRTAYYLDGDQMTNDQAVIKEFRENIATKNYGACFECCDYEDMTKEIEKLILAALATQRNEIVAKLTEFRKETWQFYHDTEEWGRQKEITSLIDRAIDLVKSCN